MFLFSLLSSILCTIVLADKNSLNQKTGLSLQQNGNDPPTVRLIELSPLDSSFAIHGNRLVGRTLQLNQKDCDGCTITVEAMFYDLSKTSIQLNDANNSYSADYLFRHSAVLTPPATASAMDNSTTDFVLTFTLLKKGQTLSSLGFGGYIPTTVYYSTLTQLVDFINDDKTRVYTMVTNNTYQQTPQLQLRDFNIAPGCAIYLFSGGLELMDGKQRHLVATLSSKLDLAPSTIRSSALTIITVPHCSFNISVYSADFPLTTPTVYAGQKGFFMSTGYPGTMGWRENGEGDNTTRVINTEGGILVNITFEIELVEAGNGGSLNIGSDSESEITYITSGKTSFNMIGSNFKIRWIPGAFPHAGYMVRYTVAPHYSGLSTRLVVLDKHDSSFVIQGNRAVGKSLQISQSDCSDCLLRVVAQIYNESLTQIHLRDGNSTFSVFDISNGHSVSLQLPATVDIYSNSTTNFVLTFTLLLPGKTFHDIGADFYSISTLDNLQSYTLNDQNGSNNSTARTLAVTNDFSQPPQIQILRFNVAPECKIEVYTGGLQSISGFGQHHLVTLTSSLSLSSSIARSPAITYITPPSCINNVTIGNVNVDPAFTTVTIGQTGFLMSSGYPGQVGYREANEIKVETVKLTAADAKTGNFTITIVSVDGGNLQINDKSFQQEQNTVFSIIESTVTIKWTPGVNPRGYLIRYSLTEDNSPKKDNDKASSLRSILLSMTIILMVWCF